MGASSIYDVAVVGSGPHLEQVTWANRRDGSTTTKKAEDLFVMIGAQPNFA